MPFKPPLPARPARETISVDEAKARTMRMLASSDPYERAYGRRLSRHIKREMKAKQYRADEAVRVAKALDR